MSNNNFFEDMQKLTSSAINAFTGSAKHVEEGVRGYIESSLVKMDFAKKEELIASQLMIQKLMDKINELEQKILALEEIVKK